MLSRKSRRQGQEVEFELLVVRYSDGAVSQNTSKTAQTLRPRRLFLQSRKHS